MNNLVLLTLCRVGFPSSLTSAISLLWDNTLHHIKTVYGTSSIAYGHTAGDPLYSPGQGCSYGPPFWNLLYKLISDSLGPTFTAAKFHSVCRSIFVSIFGSFFIDNSSLSATSDCVFDPSLSNQENTVHSIIHTITKLQSLGQHWERLLFSTGGAINIHKSHWYLMTWKWNNGQPNLSPASPTMSLNLTAGHETSPEPIPQISSHNSFRTLGVYISPSGSQLRQVKILCQHVLRNTNLTGHPPNYPKRRHTGPTCCTFT